METVLLGCLHRFPTNTAPVMMYVMCFSMFLWRVAKKGCGKKNNVMILLALHLRKFQTWVVSWR